MVDALLLTLSIQEVWNFELWEQARVAKEVPAQDWVVSGPLCHLVHSLQTEHYSTEDTLYQNLMPERKLYPSL